MAEKGASTALLECEVNEAAEIAEASVFRSLAESSAFFEAGYIGYSFRPDSPRLDGLLLKTFVWNVRVSAVSKVRSSYYDDRSRFPEGSIAFDHGLLMRDIACEWHAEPEMLGERRAKKFYNRLSENLDSRIPSHLSSSVKSAESVNQWKKRFGFGKETTD